MVQIAGLVARRIVCFVAEGAPLRTGERFGLIRFGSRLDVYLPDGVAPLVAVGPGDGGRRDGARRPRLGRAGARRARSADASRRAAGAATAACSCSWCRTSSPSSALCAGLTALRFAFAGRFEAGGGADHLRGGARRLRRAARPQARRRQPVRGRARLARRLRQLRRGAGLPRLPAGADRRARPRLDRGAGLRGLRLPAAGALQRPPRRAGDRAGRTSSGCRRRPERMLGLLPAFVSFAGIADAAAAAVAGRALARRGRAADDLPAPHLRAQGPADLARAGALAAGRRRRSSSG